MAVDPVPSGSRLRALLPRSGLGPAVGATALVLAVPVLVVVGSVFRPAGEVWRHLAATVLPEYVANSLL
ncbi:MAG: hypothetical protein AB1578_23105, partial [Thermodesulfobacteriota bacterium]